MHATKFRQEIVEDSEPERELIRQQRRLEKKRKAEALAQEAVRRLPVVAISDDSAPSSPHPLSVIEITSSSSSQSDLESSARSGALHSISVIEISDSSGVPSPAASTPSSPKNVVNGAILCDPVPSHPSLLDESPQNPNPNPVLDDPMGEDGDKPVKFDFNKFAFKNPRPLIKTKTQPKPGPSCVPSELQDCRSAKAAKTRPSVFLDTISDVQLSKLGKCVSCDIKWTTRKGVGPKRTHMKSCARKHSFTDETILVLVLRELENTLLANNDKEKAQTTVVKTPETIFEKVINDAAPKKRVRRVEVIETVKDPLDRRESIMAKAQSILLPGWSQSIDQETSMEPLPTQAFGKSALMQRQLSRMKMFYEESADSEQHLDEEILPSTQPFLPSRLGTNSWDIMNAHVQAESNINNRPTENPTPSNAPFYVVYRSSPSSSDQYPTLTSAENNEIPPPPADGIDLDIGRDDGAYLHYDPSLDEAIHHQLPTEGREKQMNKQDKPIQKRTRKDKSKEESTPSTTEEFDKEWEQAVRHKILEDQDLHQRILRYEPIHFDVFLHMVTLGSDASGKLKSQLRLLLDRLAINFYGADAVGRRKH